MKVICDNCKESYKMPRTSEIPSNINIIHCNWCPNCEDEVDEVYEEKWDEKENIKEEIIIDPAQTNLFL